MQETRIIRGRSSILRYELDKLIKLGYHIDHIITTEGNIFETSIRPHQWFVSEWLVIVSRKAVPTMNI